MIIEQCQVKCELRKSPNTAQTVTCSTINGQWANLVVFKRAPYPEFFEAKSTLLLVEVKITCYLSRLNLQLVSYICISVTHCMQTCLIYVSSLWRNNVKERCSTAPAPLWHAVFCAHKTLVDNLPSKITVMCGKKGKLYHLKCKISAESSDANVKTTQKSKQSISMRCSVHSSHCSVRLFFDYTLVYMHNCKCSSNN